MESDIGLPLYGTRMSLLVEQSAPYILLIIGIVLLFGLSRAGWFLIVVFPKAGNFG